ncbi:hypothetical protein [Butyrivibrio sp. MC2013]|uniref:hypothetical protein n=1 Tax=Butyrivibrio sp. MC2013 TaxID=1280686 RepID=UPI00041C0265|nr:hypothetical protein [Butyrivibrio sp. MC2013]
MKKIMSKSLTLLLSAALIAAMVSCGKSEDAATTAGENEPESAAENTSDAEGESDNGSSQDQGDSAAADNNSESSSEKDAEDGPGNWTASGNYIDDNDNNLIIYATSVEDGYDKDGYGIMLILGDVIYGGDMTETAKSLTGTVTGYSGDTTDELSLDITVKAEGEGMLMTTADGEEYHFVVDETDYAAMAGDMLPYFQYNQLYGDERFDPVDAACYDYLAFEAEQDYDPNNAMIPLVTVVGIDDTDADDVLIYGDYWLWEFTKEDDKLIAISGGHRPGIIHAQRFGEDETAIYSGLSLDEALTDDDAKGLFGDYYDAYIAVSSDDRARKEKMDQVLSDYVESNGLEVSGWDY